MKCEFNMRFLGSTTLCALTAGVVVLAIGGVVPSAVANTPHQAVGSWAIEPQSKDRNGDGFIDGDGGVPRSGVLSAKPSKVFVGSGNRVAQPNERLVDGHLSWYLPRKGYTVNLDACESKGDSHRWVISRDGTVVERTDSQSLDKGTCTTPVNLKEGQYTFTLIVERNGRDKRVELPAEVRGLTILSLGDSNASGEGNPRNVGAWLRSKTPLSPFTPYWDDDDCRRSTRAAPAQAALAIEESDPQVPVTFVHLACSGATIERGILGPQSRSNQTESQIDQAKRILAGTRIDAVFLSIGANDIGFAGVATACLLKLSCPLVPVTEGPLAGYSSIQEGVQAKLGGLGAGYEAIAAELRELAPNAPVYIGMYSDDTRAESGASCRYLTMTPSTFTWLREAVLTPTPEATYDYKSVQGQAYTFPLTNGTLNSQIADTSRLGFTPVIGAWSSSGDSAVGHGICAGKESWVIPVNVNGNKNGSFHPNPAGQTAIARAFQQAWEADQSS